MEVLTSSALEVAVSPRHGAVAHIGYSDGNACLWGPGPGEGYSPAQGGCFPLAPYANRIREACFSWGGRDYNIGAPVNPIDSEGPRVLEHALHGDGWRSDWKIKSAGLHTIVLEHCGRMSPFNYRARQTINLEGNRLKFELSIVHLGAEALPYGLGFHPWFPRDPDTVLLAPAQSVWMEDEQHLPTDKREIPAAWNFHRGGQALPPGFINNLFTGWSSDEDGRHRAALMYPSRNTMISIECCSYLDRYMLYSTGGDFICFEPMSHDIDAHNQGAFGGLTELKEGESVSAQMVLTFRRPMAG